MKNTKAHSLFETIANDPKLLQWARGSIKYNDTQRAAVEDFRFKLVDNKVPHEFKTEDCIQAFLLVAQMPYSAAEQGHFIHMEVERLIKHSGFTLETAGIEAQGAWDEWVAGTPTL